MDKTAALKAELMAQAEAAIDQLLKARKGRNSLSEIEGMVAHSGQVIQQQLTQALIRVESQPSGPGPACAECGREMHDKGQKKRHVVSSTGEVTVERAYYYCESCRRGYFPPG
jgi:uncharacterized protein with PIN domain